MQGSRGLQRTAEVRDPVHGYIHITEVERNIIDTPEFQRLRRIKQLAGAYLAYPGAVHSRFEHSLGSAHLAGLAATALASKGELSEDDVQLVRLAALCHDLGHGPFSHIFEEAYADRYGFTHEDMTQRVIRETSVKEVLASHGYSADELAPLAVGRAVKKPPYINELVAGGLSVDMMDYLLRDSHHAGVEYGHVDVHRLINSLEVIDGHLALDEAALYAFEAYTIARYEMFKAVYFHKTVRAADVMLIRAIEFAGKKLGQFHRKVGDYLRLDDESLLFHLTTLTRGRDLEMARELARDFRERRLVKCVFEKLLHRKDKFIERVFNQKKVRQQLVEEVARKAAVEPEKIFVDIPNAPSLPYTSDRERLKGLTLVSKSSRGRRPYRLAIEELTVVGAIAGYIDVVRVYSHREVREEAEKAAEEIFGYEGFITRISV